jgi:hypothetical protein
MSFSCASWELRSLRGTGWSAGIGDCAKIDDTIAATINKLRSKNGRFCMTFG